ncbi:hypothetical protein JL721_10308 [Aureococcus anophagefferens]|nr:hypothetical protein JL721_10308 [Aureococcus anophagefferens]
MAYHSCVAPNWYKLELPKSPRQDKFHLGDEVKRMRPRFRGLRRLDRGARKRRAELFAQLDQTADLVYALKTEMLELLEKRGRNAKRRLDLMDELDKWRGRDQHTAETLLPVAAVEQKLAGRIAIRRLLEARGSGTTATTSESANEHAGPSRDDRAAAAELLEFWDALNDVEAALELQRAQPAAAQKQSFIGSLFGSRPSTPSSRPTSPVAGPAPAPAAHGLALDVSPSPSRPPSSRATTPGGTKKTVTIQSPEGSAPPRVVTTPGGLRVDTSLDPLGLVPIEVFADAKRELWGQLGRFIPLLERCEYAEDAMWSSGRRRSASRAAACAAASADVDFKARRMQMVKTGLPRTFVDKVLKTRDADHAEAWAKFINATRSPYFKPDNDVDLVPGQRLRLLLDGVGASSHAGDGGLGGGRGAQEAGRRRRALIAGAYEDPRDKSSAPHGRAALERSATSARHLEPKKSAVASWKPARQPSLMGRLGVAEPPESPVSGGEDDERAAIDDDSTPAGLSALTDVPGASTTRSRGSCARPLRVRQLRASNAIHAAVRDKARNGPSFRKFLGTADGDAATMPFHGGSSGLKETFELKQGEALSAIELTLSPSVIEAVREASVFGGAAANKKTGGIIATMFENKRWMGLAKTKSRWSKWFGSSVSSDARTLDAALKRIFDAETAKTAAAKKEAAVLARIAAHDRMVDEQRRRGAGSAC